ncbi:MAG: ABC transporter permease [Candidatus Aminicenantes bacterium]|nr:ABC transporter permease [Candidatus Aminicenantes bacterium]MBM3311563.1 ABC transporter permease [Candidatus Aminicenantes bacterium]
MKKFRNLFFKEVKELLSKQLIVSLLLMMGMFYFIGQMTRKEAARAAAAQKISVFDLDKSALSAQLLTGLQTMNFKIEAVTAATAQAAVEAGRAGDTNLLVVIPEGFGESVRRMEPKVVETYSYLRNFSIIGARTSAIVKGFLEAINKVLSDDFLKARVPETTPEAIKSPIKSRDFIIIKSRMAEGSASAVTGFVTSQTVFIPVILMMIILYSSQMVISAIAMEKQNKTLETLLTVPIPRTSIVAAKMLASGFVGLLSAVIYMVGFRSYMSGFTGDMAQMPGVSQVVQKLGLTLNANALVILGASLFFAILCALAMATILGVLAEDFRSAQSLVMPMLILIMIPYFVSMFADVKTMSLPVKLFILAIPFSHPFLAMQNIYLENYRAVAFGVLYMAAFFGVMVYVAGRIFSTDKVLTMKLRWGKKKIVL